MRTVQLYIEGERDSGNYSEVELFDDESINLSLSVQNIQDISKVFTDFSQSFTVPASSINNAIFKHFYENDVDLDLALIDQRLKRNAFIEIDRTPFRNGKIQLEKANLKDGQAQSYSITFYGDLVTLKDTFSDDKLSDLDLTNIVSNYSYSDVVAAQTSASDLDVRYPLISTDRIWSYGDATSTDVSTVGGAIPYDSLRPAVKVNKLFESIENTYNVNFNGLFLSDKRFTDLFLWCNRTTEAQQIGNIKTVNDGVINYFNAYHPTDKVIEAVDNSNVIKVSYNNLFTTAGGFSNKIRCWIIISNVSDLSANWTLNILSNGVTYNTYTGQGSAAIDFINEYAIDESVREFEFVFSSDISVDFLPSFSYDVDYYVGSSSSAPYETGFLQFDPISISASTSIGTKLPDMKVADFFSGILKMFNLTCYPLSINTFEIEPLDYWYQKGALNDITNFVDVDSIDVAKVPLYKSINFEYEDSSLFLNKAYENTSFKKYGNLTNKFIYDGGSFDVKLPFENVLFQKFTNTNLQVAYSFDEDFNLVQTKPVLLYMYESKTVSGGYYIKSGGTLTQLTSILNFGQDIVRDNVNYSLNFGLDNSSLLFDEGLSIYSLYQTYYRSYIEQLFNYKNRLTSIKANFPTSLITNLKLNDRLIIRDKRYIINNIKTNLTSGEVDLELLNDFREISNANVTNELLPIGGVINVPVLVENKVESVTATTPTVGITLGATTTFTSDGFLEVTYPANPNGGFERITEDSQERVTERITTRRSESGSEYIIEIDLESTYFNGDTKNESLFYIQGL